MRELTHDKSAARQSEDNVLIWPQGRYPSCFAFLVLHTANGNMISYRSVLPLCHWAWLVRRRDSVACRYVVPHDQGPHLKRSVSSNRPKCHHMHVGQCHPPSQKDSIRSWTTGRRESQTFTRRIPDTVYRVCMKNS